MICPSAQAALDVFDRGPHIVTNRAHVAEPRGRITIDLHGRIIGKHAAALQARENTAQKRCRIDSKNLFVRYFDRIVEAESNVMKFIPYDTSDGPNRTVQSHRSAGDRIFLDFPFCLHVSLYKNMRPMIAKRGRKIVEFPAVLARYGASFDRDWRTTKPAAHFWAAGLLLEA